MTSLTGTASLKKTAETAPLTQYHCNHIPETIGLKPHHRNHLTETPSLKPFELQFVVFDGCFSRKFRFHHFNLQFLKYDSMSLTKFQFHNFDLQFLKNVSHKTFIFTSSICSFGRMSRTKVSLSHLHLAVFEGCPSQKFRFHMFDLQFLKDVRHESFVCTTSTCSLLKDVSHESFFLASSSCSS